MCSPVPSISQPQGRHLMSAFDSFPQAFDNTHFPQESPSSKETPKSFNFHLVTETKSIFTLVILLWVTSVRQCPSVGVSGHFLFL